MLKEDLVTMLDENDIEQVVYKQWVQLTGLLWKLVVLPLMTSSVKS